MNNPHIDPIFGESRNEYCREEWWRARQSEENADKTERKAAGMQMGLGVPQGATFLDERGNAIFPREMAENLVNAAVRGDCFTYPLTAFSKQDCIRNPALMDIPAVKVTQYDWGNNGPALTAHLSRISAIDRKIMMARMRPSREAMEGTSGTRAEAGVHGQIGVTDSELVAAQQLSQITTQVLDRWAVTNFGAKAAGMLVAKQAPLSDPQQQFLQDVYKALCSGQKPDAETVAQIDRRALGTRVEMPLLDQKTVEATLASQQGGATTPSLESQSPKQVDEETVSQVPGLAAADAGALALTDQLPGHRWITIDGRHVYIKDGGAHHMPGKADAEPPQHAAATHASPVEGLIWGKDGILRYQVQKGDNLYKIAEKLTGSRNNEKALERWVKDPSHLVPGQEIIITDAIENKPGIKLLPGILPPWPFPQFAPPAWAEHQFATAGFWNAVLDPSNWNAWLAKLPPADLVAPGSVVGAAALDIARTILGKVAIGTAIRRLKEIAKNMRDNGTSLLAGASPLLSAAWQLVRRLAPPNTGGAPALATEANVEELARVLMSETSVGNAIERSAVGSTILNRMRRNGTNSVVDITGHGAYARNQPPNAAMRQLATQLLNGQIPDNTNGATHFYSPRSMHPADRVPDWVPHMDPRGVNGARDNYYRFYRDRGNGPTR